MILIADTSQAVRLADHGFLVVVGEIDDPETYRHVEVGRAALLVTTRSDMINKDVTFTSPEVAPNIPIFATCNAANSVDVLQLAVATHLMQIGEMVGEALARCTVGGDAVTHAAEKVDELLIAEANAIRTPMVGKTIREARLAQLSINVVGIWQRGKFTYAMADTVIGENLILVLAGSSQHLLNYDERYISTTCRANQWSCLGVVVSVERHREHWRSGESIRAFSKNITNASLIRSENKRDARFLRFAKNQVRKSIHLHTRSSKAGVN
ncbi:MAG: hypothetical protein HKN47_06005 [Pirellulaceae bacterium]|nr:hypothetical protein [Pirellulaceae bacterium]